jgi:hypothetical protein
MKAKMQNGEKMTEVALGMQHPRQGHRLETSTTNPNYA